MKKTLCSLALLATILLSIAATGVNIIWYSQSPHAGSVAASDLFSIQRTSPNSYFYITASQLKSYVASGIAGVNGTNGLAGVNGTNGTSGTNGVAVPGTNGLNGTSGTNTTSVSTNSAFVLSVGITNLNFIDGTNIHFSGTYSGQTVTIKADFTGTNAGPQGISGTNGVNGTSGTNANVVSLTNNQFKTVDMTIKEGDFRTNAAFSFLGIINKSTSNYQSVVITVTNSSGAAVSITAPTGTHTNGTLPYNVTNVSKVLIEYHPVFNYTNMLVYPLF